MPSFARLWALMLVLLTSSAAQAVLSASEGTSQRRERVLYVLTNHGQMGETGKRTGFYLSELTHPYYIIQDAGYEIDLASPLGGPAPIDPTSLDMDDRSNQRFLVI